MWSLAGRNFMNRLSATLVVACLIMWSCYRMWISLVDKLVCFAMIWNTLVEVCWIMFNLFVCNLMPLSVGCFIFEICVIRVVEAWQWLSCVWFVYDVVESVSTLLNISKVGLLWWMLHVVWLSCVHSRRI